MKEFKTAAMDPTTKIITLIFGGICIAAIIVLLFFPHSGDDYQAILIVILAAALISSYVMIPKLAVTAETVVIRNVFTTIKIPFDQIQKIERFEKIKFNIRTFGVGGLFGYFGYFNGTDVWYVTNIKKKIKITTSSGKIYMISPEDPNGFLAEMGRNSL